MKNSLFSISDYCQTEESLCSISTSGSANAIEDKNALVSFQKFVHCIQLGDYNDNELKWNSKLREDAYQSQKDKRRIILKELQQIDYKDPLSIISHLYLRDRYSLEMFIQSIKNIPKDNEMCFIIEERERMELISKIIEYYLHYMTKNSFDIIIKGLIRLNELESSVNESHAVINFNKNKMKVIKKHFIEASAKLTLTKCKCENMKKTLGFIKSVLIDPIAKWNKIRLGHYSYIDYYYANETLMNSLNKLVLKYPIVNALISIKDKCIDKKKELFALYRIDIENMFEEKKHCVIDLFCLYIIDNHSDQISYVDLMGQFVSSITKIFNQKAKELIIRTSYDYSRKNNSNCNGFNAFDYIKKIKHIAVLIYEEESFIQCIKTMLLELKKMIEIYLSYQSYDNCFSQTYPRPIGNEVSFEQLKMMLKDNQLIIYTIIEKALAKFISSIGTCLRYFVNKKPILITATLICLFEQLIKSKMAIDYSKYLPLALRNMIINNMKFTNLKNIIKQSVLLTQDIWNKKNLEEDFEYVVLDHIINPFSLLSLHKINETNTITLRNYLTIFNKEANDFVNNDTIETIFDEFFSSEANCDIIIANVNTNKSSFDLTILSNALNTSKMILSTSSIHLIKAISVLIEDMLFYDNIAFEIFYEIFNIVDYFIFASLNMFIQNKSVLKSLIDNINTIDTISKPIQVNYHLGIYQLTQIRLQTAFPNLRQFLILTMKKLESILNIKEGIDIEKNSSSFETSFSFPQINSVLIKSATPGSNIIYHSVIAMESIHSIYKIIKRLKHFSLKIDLEFQRDFIENTISQYKTVIKEMSSFLYYALAKEIIDNDKDMGNICSQISNSNYNIREIEVNTKLLEASPFIEDICAFAKQWCIKQSQLNTINKKIQRTFYTEMLKCVIENTSNAFVSIKYCNASGRSLMLKDVKMLKNALEDLLNNEWGFNVNFNKQFYGIFASINAWYYPKEALMTFINENIAYNHWICLLNTCPCIQSLSRTAKKEFMKAIEDHYNKWFYKEIERLIIVYK